MAVEANGKQPVSKTVWWPAMVTCGFESHHCRLILIVGSTPLTTVWDSCYTFVVKVDSYGCTK